MNTNGLGVCMARHFIVAHCGLNHWHLLREWNHPKCPHGFLRWIRLSHRSEFAKVSNSVLSNRKNLTKTFSFYNWYMWTVLTPIYFQKHMIYSKYKLYTFYCWVVISRRIYVTFFASDSLAMVVGNTESVYLPYCFQQLLTIDSKGDAFVSRTYLLTALLSDLNVTSNFQWP